METRPRARWVRLQMMLLGGELMVFDLQKLNAAKAEETEQKKKW